MSLKDFALILIAFGFALIAKPAFASFSAKERLRQSALYFDRGQYEKALSSIRALDIRADFDNSDDMKLAFKIRAIAYAQTGDSVRAVETIRELFFLDPSYQFNPFDTPKSVVILAQKEKAAIDEKNQHLAARKGETLGEHAAHREPPQKIVVIEKRPEPVTTLFPFGINHFALHSPMKGGIYLSLQTLSIATNIAAFWWKTSYLAEFGARHLKQSANKSGFETAQTIQFISLGTLLISYGISIIDALIHWQSIPAQNEGLNEITREGR